MLRLAFAVVDVVADLLRVEDVRHCIRYVGSQGPGEAVQAHVVLQVLTHARHLGHYRQLYRTPRETT